MNIYKSWQVFRAFWIWCEKRHNEYISWIYHVRWKRIVFDGPYSIVSEAHIRILVDFYFGIARWLKTVLNDLLCCAVNDLVSTLYHTNPLRRDAMAAEARVFSQEIWLLGHDHTRGHIFTTRALDPLSGCAKALAFFAQSNTKYNWLKNFDNLLKILKEYSWKRHRVLGQRP